MSSNEMSDEVRRISVGPMICGSDYMDSVITSDGGRLTVKAVKDESKKVNGVLYRITELTPQGFSETKVTNDYSEHVKTLNYGKSDMPGLDAFVARAKAVYRRGIPSVSLVALPQPDIERRYHDGFVTAIKTHADGRKEIKTSDSLSVIDAFCKPSESPHLDTFIERAKQRCRAKYTESKA